jgi:PAS domain S-box-containing protein
MQHTKDKIPSLSRTAENLGIHDHLCLIYETQREQFSIVLPFIRTGLMQGDKCVYIADDNTAAQVMEAMISEGIDVDKMQKKGALVILNKQDVYLKQGSFDPDWMIDFLKDSTDSARADGFTALRVTGEMTWTLGGDPGVEKLAEYEAKLNNFLPSNDALAICQYNYNRFSPEVIIDVIRTHPLVIFKETVCRNFYYVPPEEFFNPNKRSLQVQRLLDNIIDRERVEEEIRKANEELEKKVIERTSELNEELTERKRAEEEALSARMWLEHLLAGSSAVIYSCEVESPYGATYISKTAEIITGYKPSDFTGDPTFWSKKIHPDDVQRVLDELPAVFDKGFHIHEYRWKKKDGTYIWMHDELKLSYDPDGKPNDMIGVWIDITDRKQAEEKAAQAKQTLQNILDSTPYSVMLVGKDKVIRYVNSAALKLGGYESSEELVGSVCNEVLCPTQRCPILDFGQKLDKSERVIKAKDGTHIPILKSVVPITADGEELLLESFVDISDIKRAEESLKRTSHKLGERVKELNCLYSISRILDEPDISTDRILGDIVNVLPSSWQYPEITCARVTVENQTSMTEHFRETPWRQSSDIIIRDNKIGEIEVFYLEEKPQNHEGPFLEEERNLIDGISKMMGIAFERKMADNELKQSLKDKDILMKEIHHRVKNNMSVIQSLLSLQLHNVSDEKFKAYFRDAKNRVKSMSMIHERLSRSDELSKMDLSEFIKSLTNYLFQSSGLDPNKVQLVVNIPEITIDVETMMPCGLIINELVTNTFKYAFPDDRAGVVTIGLHMEKDNEITLSVKDNGVGIQDDFNLYETKSLGLQIVSALTNQIHGDLELIKDNGTEIRITFKEKRFR